MKKEEMKVLNMEELETVEALNWQDVAIGIGIGLGAGVIIGLT